MNIENDMKAYWYSLCFAYLKDGGLSYANGYIGRTKNVVSKHDIDDAKKHSKIPENAVLMSCSYLGYATKQEMGFDT